MLYSDLVLINGNIITMNSEQPRAQALAIKDGKFVAIGTNEQILSHLGKHTKKIDLKGETVVPGFIDTHAHGAAFGRGLLQIDLRDVGSIKEIQQKVKHWADKTPKGEWIFGHGWDQDELAEQRYPSNLDLDQAAPNHPVLLHRACGHLGVVSSEAMKAAGITKETKPPKGGIIDRDPKTGVPNGVLRENALDLVSSILPKPSEEQLEKICQLACQRMVEEGITTVHWILGSTREMSILQKLNDRNMLPLRIYALIPIECIDQLIDLGISTGFGGDKIKVGSAKILADGSLGGRTAALKRPYNDEPDTRGLMLYSRKQLEKLVEKAHKANLQLAIHAIGEKTIETVLKIVEKALKKVPKKNHRHRIEHASVLHPKLIRKMKELGVIASVQPHFVVSDFWITRRLGKARARWTYAFKSLLDEGVMTTGGSDAPIEPVSPMLGIYAAVARETVPQERLTVDEALRLYTVNAAYASFEEGVKGAIEKGKFADLVVLSQNPYKTPPRKIKDIKIEMTIVGGNIVHAGK